MNFITTQQSRKEPRHETSNKDRGNAQRKTRGRFILEARIPIHPHNTSNYTNYINNKQVSGDYND